MRALPMLEGRRHNYETCVYCPKLCRSACPVSNAEPRETLIPWGKMSTAYFAARGDVPLEESFAAPAWACTGCHACRESCDHKNDVAGSLMDARDAFVTNGLGPAASKRVLDRFASPSATGGALLVGCLYDRKLPDVARAAASAAKKLFGDVSIERACCGLPLRLAGDKKRFEEHARKFAGREMIAVDPGCAMTLRAAGARVTMLVERAAERVTSLREGPHDERPREMRWHDPCQLGRGLGLYDAPRVVLTRVLGRAPLEFPMRRERAECSGGGGLLPLTMPDNSRAIADKRIADSGGAPIVTACASSVLRFRSAGASVTDIVTLIDAAL
ncbi:MAG TPA: (Fe-S)-binding protein [Polyangiaceae bacterium]|jgi:Fe-S oxidoreductase|nr:(Fe-S)-binding protein [Polyangiaceae bacterium]